MHAYGARLPASVRALREVCAADSGGLDGLGGLAARQEQRRERVHGISLERPVDAVRLPYLWALINSR
jgi:hypothetical protein